MYSSNEYLGSIYLVLNKTCVWKNGDIVGEGGHPLWKSENLLTKSCPCKLSFYCFSKIPESNHFQGGSTYFGSWSWRSCSVVRRPLLLELWWGSTAGQELMIEEEAVNSLQPGSKDRKVQGLQSLQGHSPWPSSLLVGLISYRRWHLLVSPQDAY